MAPKLDADGLIPCVTTDAGTADVLTLEYMKRDAPRRMTGLIDENDRCAGRRNAATRT